MKLNNILASLFATAAVLVGCTLEEPVSKLSGLEVSNDYVTVEADNQTSATITVLADESWTATPQADWVTVNPTSGSAGQTVTMTLTATPATAARNTEVHIKMGAKTKIISFNQKAPAGVDTPPSTCAEVIAGENITYKVIGTVTKIVNTQYGNWYLADDTGEIYIYGTFNSKGAYPKDSDGWDAFGIEVGDKVMVEGPKTVYNGTVELVDVSYKIVQKSLIDASLTTEVLTPGAGTDTLLVSSKVQPVLVSIESDWIKVADLTADGNYILSYNANTRTAERTATITIKAPGAMKSLTVKQEGVEPTGLTITEIVAEEDNSIVETLECTTVAKTTRGIVVSDGTTALYVYGNKVDGVKVGDNLKIWAKKTTYNGVPELTDITAIDVISSGNSVKHPDAKDVTATATEYSAKVAEYVRLSGTLTVSGNYYNIALDGVETDVKQGSIVYPTDDLNAKSFDGKKITVTGYYNGLSGGGKFLNIIATKIAEFVDNPKGTLKNPYDATELANLLKGGATFDEPVYARGIINKIDKVDTGFGNAQYWLSTDGSAADLEVYRGFYYGGEKFTEETAEAIKVGDEVVVYGKVKVYKETAEFDANNYLVTINGKAAPAGDGTADNPYNVTKLASMLLAGETFDGEVYAKGIISQIDNVNLQYGNAQYWISDDGSKLFQMEVYRAFWFGGEKFTSEDQIALGDEVVVCGKVKVYKDTPEFDANNKIISLNGKTE